MTTEGERYSKEGTPEFKILKTLLSNPDKKAEKSDVEKTMESNEFKVGLANGMKKYFKLEKTVLVSIVDTEAVDSDAELLNKLLKADYFDASIDKLKDSEEVKKLKKRQLIDIKTLTYFKIEKGENFAPTLIIKRADLTSEDLVSGIWENSELFKGLNLTAKGKESNIGGLHPLLKMRSEFRQTLLEMGF